MSKPLVAYFSASGVTEKTAETLAKTINADLFEIEPETPYTAADLDWTDKNSRSTVEMNDLSSRPAIKSKLDDMGGYDVVFVGFPIWWYVAPTIINTFLESYDFKGKTVVPFAMSGGSGMGKTAEVLRKLNTGAKILDGKVLNGYDAAAMKKWVESLKI